MSRLRAVGVFHPAERQAEVCVGTLGVYEARVVGEQGVHGCPWGACRR
jgi:hypothetical protein